MLSQLIALLVKLGIRQALLTIDGGNGNDRLQGDQGSDLFIFRGNFGRDRILDFGIGNDRIGRLLWIYGSINALLLLAAFNIRRSVRREMAAEREVSG